MHNPINFREHMDDSVLDAADVVAQRVGVEEGRRPSQRIKAVEERLEAHERDTRLYILLGSIALAFDAALVLLIVMGAFS